MSRHAFSPEQCRAGGAKPDLVKRAALMAIVERNGGNIAKTARELGVSKSTVRSAVKRARGYKLPRGKAPAVVRLPVVAAQGNPTGKLVEDRRHETVERRRSDCVHRKACEAAWIAEHWDKQAMCPIACRSYQKEERR